MIVHRADWVLPIAGPPIRDGWVAVHDGRIAGCGSTESPPGTPGVRPFERDPFVILPALVNAHAHIELSYLRGAVPPAGQFDHWIRTLVTTRRERGAVGAAVESEARDAILQARAAGTGLIGDVGNTLVTLPLFEAARVAAHVFYELIGFNTPDPELAVCRAREQVDGATASGSNVRASLAPHAPYSVSPALFRAIRHDLGRHPDTVSSVHLGESRDELEFLLHGGGAIRAALEALGAWNPEWQPPGSGPVDYIEQVGLLDPRVLIVHAVQLTDAELRRVQAAGATVVTCPRSNRWTGAGSPPIERFYASGVPVAIGTDSLASVDDLNMFSELAAARALAPELPARRLLESATMVGAAALGFGDELGTIVPGKTASLIAVRIPAGVADVEEYLLSGIEPEDVKWIPAGEPVSGDLR